ncbi:MULTISPECIES: acyl carrier protein [Bradyrhizobium]|jgi:acyl carrier protein|uniref:acyl carrier protein n=1 Tax=Bradyrhizobium TaxID=374 RepID=UPI0003FF3EF8|nr:MULTISPECIES: acyl carrier protein [Bradyrhizobium]WLB90235.1 acyl carrier protein [Bradyrhizobium japonicum USDA 135]GLR92553.1 acyl carrier protein [Bradyrhizobium liaoningense]
MSDFETRVQNVFREVFDNPDLNIYREMQAKHVVGWDSLNHITLIMTLEETFKVKFSTREVMGFQNVGEMMDCLREKLPT